MDSAMDPFIDLNPKSDSAKADQALSSLLARYANAQSIVGSNPDLVSKKRRFIDDVLEALGPNGAAEKWSPAVVTKALDCLKVLCRETSGSEFIICEEGMQVLIKYAGLVPALTFSEKPVETESMKVMINCLRHSPECRSFYHTSSALSNSIAYLHDHPTTSIDTRFLILRLMFLATADPSAAPPTSLFFPVVTNALKAGTYAILGNVEKAYEPPRGGALANEVGIVSEVLKIVFNLMLSEGVGEIGGSGGPLGGLLKGNKSSASVNTMAEHDRMSPATSFKPLLPVILELYSKLPPAHAPYPPLSPPHSHAIHALMSFPVSPLPSAADDEAWIDSWFPGGNYAVVQQSLEILERVIAHAYGGTDSAAPGSVDERPTIGGQKVDDVLSPLLILMTHLAAGDRRAREMMRGKIMPDDIDRSKPLDKGSAIPNVMIRFMTSVTMNNVRESASELLFELSGADASVLCEYVGYGNAAGFLFHKGLLPNRPSGASGTSGDDASSTMSGATLLGRGQDVNPITGESGEAERQRAAQAEWEAMTDEEKEREGEKLLVLFERLNRTGIIKVATPTDAAGPSSRT
ncbi:guanine nucleotide exchange factor [Cladochytrium replicatum]|nr:guanine nucleotide exchange factor [Cladochytrium replicatum]